MENVSLSTPQQAPAPGLAPRLAGLGLALPGTLIERPASPDATAKGGAPARASPAAGTPGPTPPPRAPGSDYPAPLGIPPPSRRPGRRARVPPAGGADQPPSHRRHH